MPYSRFIYFCLVAILLISFPVITWAYDDDYPYPNSCTSFTEECEDPWGFYNRQCTSYVAWCMNRDAQTASSPYSFKNGMDGGHWGNAYNWDNNAQDLGITVSSVPVVGAVAQWNVGEIGGDWGHVAYVEKVYSDGYVDVTEYNVIRHSFGSRKVKAPRYIYVNASFQTIYDYNNNTSEGWTAGNAISNQHFEGGNWIFSSGIDPYIKSPRLADGITAGQFRKVEVSMSVLGDHRKEDAFIYFDTGNGFNDSEKFHLGEVLTNGAAQIYLVNFPQSVIDQNKPLYQIRFDPLYSEGLPYTPDDEVSLNFIRLVSDYHYWHFQENPLGWTLGNAFSDGFIGSWAWKIQATSGDPQLKSPWLSLVNTGIYDSVYLRFAVNRDQNPAGEQLTGKIYFDLYDDSIEGFTESIHSEFLVTPDSTQREYIVPIPDTEKCTKIHRIRVDFYEGTQDEKYPIYIDKIEFMKNGENASSVNKSESLWLQEIQATSSSSDSYITIHDIGDLFVPNNSQITIIASANGCCSDEYNWSLIENPLELSVNSDGIITGNSGSVSGLYTATIRAEDKYDSTNFTEKSFNITVNSDSRSDSIRIFNDGTGIINILSISMENNSPWINIDPPGPSFTIEQGGFEDIFLSVDKQGLDIGNYSDNIVISSNDCNDSSIIVPVNLQIDSDTAAPPAPQSLSATPDFWFSNGNVSIDWVNPADPSGISGGYYKMGGPPDFDEDGVFDSNKPIQIPPLTDGMQTIYLWLVDGDGNTDHHNMNSTTFYYDGSPPSVLSKYPDDGATDIPVDTEILIHIEDLCAGIEINSIDLKINGTSVVPVITGSPSGYSLSYSPDQHFAYGENVTVSIEAADLSSPANQLNPVVWTFNTISAPTEPVVDYFLINEGDDSTESRIVSLSNYASGSPTEYMASEQSDFSGSSWQPYSINPVYSLSIGNGIKTVYFKVINSAGESNILSDTISLEEPIQNCEILDVSASLSSSVIYDPPHSAYQYRYGPSITVNGDTVDMWTAAPDPSASAWDRIEHRRGTLTVEGTIQWTTDWTSVLEATPNSRDRYSCCDPGVFSYNGYYYIGYTSTDQEEGGGATSNDIFVARFNSLPDGSPGITYEKWNGTGWGGDPQPIIEYNGDGWGKAQPSFVVKDDILYIYYTDDGTKVVTVDATNENWPSLINEGQADTIFTNISARTTYGGKPGPFEVKYIDEYNKFIGIGVSNEFKLEPEPDNYVFICASVDGITFEPVATSQAYWGAMVLGDGGPGGAHNIGISGDSEGHLDIGSTNFIAYAYGLSQMIVEQPYRGRWPTYMNVIEIDECRSVELFDAINALQILSGISQTPLNVKDVNGDGKIGMEDVIYILQKVSGLRE